MPKVLTVKLGGTVTCGHPVGAGGVASTVSSAKLTVNGNAVLLQSSIEGKSIDSTKCAIPPPGSKCNRVIKVTSGWANKLTAGNQPVILDTLKGMTNGVVGGVTPQTLLSGQAVQTKLTAI